MKTLKKESSQEPDKSQSASEQDEPEFETSRTSQKIGQLQKDSEGQLTRSTEDVEPMEHSLAGAAGSGPSVMPRFPGAQEGIWAEHTTSIPNTSNGTRDTVRRDRAKGKTI